MGWPKDDRENEENHAALAYFAVLVGRHAAANRVSKAL
jgi:hypothetical protein